MPTDLAPERPSSTQTELICRRLFVSRPFTRLLEVGPSYGYFAEPARPRAFLSSRRDTWSKPSLCLLTCRSKLCSPVAFWEVVLVLQMVSANMCPARLTRGSNVSSDLPKLQEPTCLLCLYPLCLLRVGIPAACCKWL